MVLTEMIVAVTRERVRRAEAGSYEGWKAQRTAAVALGLRARLLQNWDSGHSWEEERM